MSDTALPGQMALYQWVGLVLGPLLFAICMLLPPPEGLSLPGWRVVAVMALMAVWWATEAIPVPATSLIPIIFFPLLGVSSLEAASQPYSSSVIYLLLGGMIVALTLERWGLHKRMALMILSRVGDRPNAIILGFMVATAVLSMWVSNSAATLMMMPIALSVSTVVMAEHGDDRRFAIALLLGVAYGASIGGLGTLVGTPPNAMVAGYVKQNFGTEITFVQWMAYGVPVVVCMVPAAWWVLTRWAFRLDLPTNPEAATVIRQELAAMGAMSTPERRTLITFAVVAVAWITSPLLKLIPGLANLSDTVIAVMGALAVFLIPSGADKRSFLMNWETAVKVPWGVILLFGSGLSLAAMVSSTGLAEWVGQSLSGLATLPTLALTAIVVTLVIFLTELTSNTGTTDTILPILGALAVTGGFNPMLIAAPAAIAATSAFMLPVATAPNAVVYGSGYIRVPDMAQAGFRLNILGIFVITALSYALVPVVFAP